MIPDNSNNRYDSISLNVNELLVIIDNIMDIRM